MHGMSSPEVMGRRFPAQLEPPPPPDTCLRQVAMMGVHLWCFLRSFVEFENESLVGSLCVRILVYLKLIYIGRERCAEMGCDLRLWP